MLPQFTKNDVRLSFLLILEVSLAMTSFGFFVASLLRKVSLFPEKQLYRLQICLVSLTADLID